MFSGLSGFDITFLFVALVISVVLHEMMHGVVAFWLGDTTAAEHGRLTLNPLKSVDPITTILLPLLLIITVGQPFFAAKPVPFNPNRVKWDEYGAALVGLAGPATNFLLAIVGAGLYHLTAGQGSPVNTFAYYFTIVNVGLMVFNLIPFPPLDGSRLLYAFAPEPLQELMERIERFGFLAILVFILIIFQFISPAISNIEIHILSWLLG